MANEKTQNVQDVFLNHVRKSKAPVTVFLVNGVKLQGIITWFDNFSVLLRRDGHTQLVYKHAISTVMPGAPIQLFDATKGGGRRTIPGSGAGAGHCRLDRLRPARVRPAPPSSCPGKSPGRGDGAARAADAKLAEAAGLAASIGLSVVHTAILPLRARRSATLLGVGQVADQAEALKEAAVSVAVVDAALSPVQQRNLERGWGCKVIDRTGLILDIFGERARTREGALQVELAHLDYQRSRLVRSLDPPGTAAWRFRLPGRARRDADRGRPPADHRPHRAPEEGAGAGPPHPRPPPRRPHPRAIPGSRPGRLHECRQVHPVQRPDRRRRARRRQAVRHLGPDDARVAAGFGPPRDPVGHGWVHQRVADRAGRGLPRNAGGGGPGRSHPPCARCCPSG